MNFLQTLSLLAIKSLINRRLSAGLTIFALSISVFLLLGVDKIRIEAKQSFANTISGTDLVVGARSGSIQLLLYSVFRIGNATNNVSWRSYEAITQSPDVAWAIPFSLGDSHRGFRVLGTSTDYFKHYRYGRRANIRFSHGEPFSDVFDAVLGAQVAEELGYRLNDKIVIAHGISDLSGVDHGDKPFRISGILTKTGTPLDRTVHISLEGMEAIHVDWRQGAPIPGMQVSAEEVRKLKLQPRAITAFLVGLKSKLAIFKVQRQINNYRREPLQAILPGVALQELWDLMSTVEEALGVISIFVVVTGLLVMLTMLLSGLNERRREMAILRSVGAGKPHVFSLLIFEAGFLTACGIIIGVALLYLSLAIGQPIFETEYGLFIAIEFLSARELSILGVILLAGIVSGAVPAYRSYRDSVAHGMIVRD